jgi:hypothetical protein
VTTSSPTRRRERTRTARLALLTAGSLLATQALVAAVPAVADGDLQAPCVLGADGVTVTCEYAFTGAPRQFVVPLGVSEVSVVAVGGAGGAGGQGSLSTPNPGGRAAEVRGSVTGLEPRQVLHVVVGGSATGDVAPDSGINRCGGRTDVQCKGGYNGGGDSTFRNQLVAPGGGGGGGASDVRTVALGQPGTLESRRLVAGGGGGGGGPAGGLPRRAADQARGRRRRRCAGCRRRDLPELEHLPRRRAHPRRQPARRAVRRRGRRGELGQPPAPAAQRPDDTAVRTANRGTAGSFGQGGPGPAYGGSGGGGWYGGGGGSDPLTEYATRELEIIAGGGGAGGSSLVPPGGSVQLTTAPPSITLTYRLVKVAPTVTAQPQSVTVLEREAVSFTAEASGVFRPTVRWQRSNDAGATWADVFSRTSTSRTLVLDDVRATDSGARFRALFTNDTGTALTSAAVLTVNTLPVFTNQPQEAFAVPGERVTFTADATARPEPAPAGWQVSRDLGHDLDRPRRFGEQELHDPARERRRQRPALPLPLVQRHRVHVLRPGPAGGGQRTGDRSPRAAPSTTPTDRRRGRDRLLPLGSLWPAVPDDAVATLDDGGLTFTDVPGATEFAYRTPPTTPADDGVLFRAVHTNQLGSVTSRAATLTVRHAPRVTTQPTDQVAAEGQSASFTAAAGARPAPTCSGSAPPTRGRPGPTSPARRRRRSRRRPRPPATTAPATARCSPTTWAARPATLPG